MFIHTVYFWVKAGTAAGAVDALVKDCREILAKIPTVRKVWAGRAAGTPRDVVDNSFAVGLTVAFDDAAGHDTYQSHALHLEFIARNSKHWQRVQAYDFVE